MWSGGKGVLGVSEEHIEFLIPHLWPLLTRQTLGLGSGSKFDQLLKFGQLSGCKCLLLAPAGLLKAKL